MELCNATKDDLDKVEQLYKSVIGLPYCVWNEEYPSRFEIEEDFKFNCLYILKELDDIIAAVSVNPYDEMSDSNAWTKTKKPCEIARVVVCKEYQNKSIGKYMINKLLERLRDLSFTSVRLAVEVNHVPAIKLYESCGFIRVGCHFMYEHHYYLYEYLM